LVIGLSERKSWKRGWKEMGSRRISKLVTVKESVKGLIVRVANPVPTSSDVQVWIKKRTTYKGTERGLHLTPYREKKTPTREMAGGAGVSPSSQIRGSSWGPRGATVGLGLRPQKGGQNR